MTLLNLAQDPIMSSSELLGRYNFRLYMYSNSTYMYCLSYEKAPITWRKVEYEISVIERAVNADETMS